VIDAKELIESGKLDEAVTALTAAVKANPGHGQARVSLFEALCFQGDLDRAGRQLEVFSQGGADFDSEVAVQVYRNLLAAERKRRDVFNGTALPRFLFTPPPYVDRYVTMVRTLATSPAEGAALLADAESETPAWRGTMGDRAFASFRDADDRLAPVLELAQDSDYVWLPIEQITQLTITPPKRLRELIWVHAQVETVDGSSGDVFLPVLYPNSYAHADPLVKLGQQTDWEAVEDQMVVGRGRHMFLVDGEEVSILELGTVVFERTATTSGQRSAVSGQEG
jgi:type VI secretion system protein ImpE